MKKYDLSWCGAECAAKDESQTSSSPQLNLHLRSAPVIFIIIKY
jgi:hypothetical protein